MTVDLRALAERLGMLKDCPCEGNDLWGAEFNDDAVPLPCPACNSVGQRLPTEAEVRAAIFEAGWTWLEVHEGRGEGVVVVRGARRSDGPDIEAQANPDETPYESLVLLALLRALEGCRG